MVFYEKNQFPNGFLFRAWISFSAHISWNNGFTAILTKFSGHQRSRYFMRRINSQMVFYFGPWFRFLHMPRVIMVLRRFWRNFCHLQRGRYFMRRINSQMVFLFRALISFFAYISWNNGFTAILTKFLPFTKREVFYEKNQFPNGFFISGLDFVFCIYLVK